MIGKRIVVLSLTKGRGGGIERYVRGVCDALTLSGSEVDELCVHNGAPGRRHIWVDYLKFAFGCIRYVCGSSGPMIVVATHRNLLPLVILFSASRRLERFVVVFHGVELWGEQARRSRCWLKFKCVHIIAVSNFTAGALLPSFDKATVLSPAIARPWYEQLIKAGTAQRPVLESDVVRVLSVFRLEDWKKKGLREIVCAIDAMNDRRVTLRVVGSGEIDPELRSLKATRPWLRIESNVSDTALIEAYKAADVFVLASRLIRGKGACGEGFGQVLVEAQLVGLPVIAPAHGGSADALVQGWTGLIPQDESAEALLQVLRELVDSEELRTELGARGLEWARSRFAPEDYAVKVSRAIFGFRSSSENVMWSK